MTMDRTRRALAGPVPRSARLLACLSATLVLLVLPACGPSLDSKDPEERLEAVRRLDDPSHLRRIAVLDRDRSVALAAVARLSDPEQLASVACSVQADVACAAVARLDDPARLALTALRADCREARLLAAERLSDPTHLRLLALAPGTGRTPANPHDRAPCLAALKKLSDESVLLEVARTSRDPHLRRVATSRIHSDTLLDVLVRTSSDPRVRHLALGAIDDASLLDTLRTTLTDPQLREAATRRITLLERLTALRPHSPAALETMALSSPVALDRLAAATALTSMESLTRVVLHASDPAVRTRALTRLDTPTLRSLTQTDPPLRWAAAALLGTPWPDLLERVDLLEAHRASNLLSYPHCAAPWDFDLIAIRIIDTAQHHRIPELQALLSHSSSHDLALILLNSGHSDLTATARTWATRSGFRIESTPGGARASWGRHR